jgi:hypothetical protein
LPLVKKKIPFHSQHPRHSYPPVCVVLKCPQESIKIASKDLPVRSLTTRDILDYSAYNPLRKTFFIAIPLLSALPNLPIQKKCFLYNLILSGVMFHQ